MSGRSKIRHLTVLPIQSALVNTSTGSPASDQYPWLPAALAALLSLAIYAVTLGGVSNIYDDQFLVLLDPRVQHPNQWVQFWTKDTFNGGLDNLYRPLASQSLGLQWWLQGGDKPWAFHLVNVLLFAGAAAAVAEFGRRLAGWRVGLIGGLLFAVHPVHVEAVAAIVGRNELLCALGVLGALIVFIRPLLSTRRVLGIFSLFLLALLSKEPGLLLPLLLIALLIARPPADQSEQRPLRLLTLLLVWSLGMYIFLREKYLKFEWDRSFLNWGIQPLVRAHGWDRWLIPVALIGRYLRLLVAPTHLSIDYGVAVIGYTIDRTDPYLWLGFAAILAWLAAVYFCWRYRQRAALFCLLAMAITYSMASNIVIVGTIFGERLMFLPSAFFVILVAMLLARLGSGLRTTTVAFILILACVRTFTYASQWNDRDRFYAYSYQQQPRSVRIALLLADVDRQEKKLDDARQIMRDSREMLPDYWETQMYSGHIEEDAGNWQAAVDFYTRTFHLLPTQKTAELMSDAQQKLAASQASTR